MAGLDPAIQAGGAEDRRRFANVVQSAEAAAWMAGSSPAMTVV
jgi:hypothetical protein